MVLALKNRDAASKIDERTTVSAAAVRRLKKSGGKYGIKFDHTDNTAVNIAKTLRSVYAAVWMEEFFKLTGDPMPNTNGELHLEKQEMRSIWLEYFEDFEAKGRAPLCYQAFITLWRTAFPHVKIRAYKQVSGKCYVCLVLGFLRGMFKDETRRSLIKELHAHHRSTYMKERFEYYKRAEKAVNYPTDYFSSISDGMASNKTRCPSTKDTFDFKPSLPIHLQAELAHGRSLDIYQTFHNLKKTANVAIHCWLCSLEKEYQLHGRLPNTIYHQIDGGVENTAKSALGIAELLVARRLTRKVVVTRLPVGHTHEVNI
jgi:hypothetical protein